MVISLSTAAFDSFQSAMVSTGSNDLFRNRLGIWWIRGLVVLIIFPVVVVALRSPSVLQIFLISDLISASAIPVLLIGLSDKCHWWTGWEVVTGGMGGILSVFIFGTIYQGSVQAGAKLLLLEEGFYSNDWSVFGAFAVAPFGGVLWAALMFLGRNLFLLILARVPGSRTKRGSSYTVTFPESNP